MYFIKNIPYQLGTSFDENNIDLELQKEYVVSKIYRSYKYSEIYLFGKCFESECYLWFNKSKLINIEYRFDRRHLRFFVESINSELPIDKPLKKDAFNPKPAMESFVDGVAISLVILNEDIFLFRISKIPSMPRIKT